MRRCRRNRFHYKIYWLSGAALGEIAFWMIVLIGAMVVQLAVRAWRGVMYLAGRRLTIANPYHGIWRPAWLAPGGALSCLRAFDVGAHARRHLGEVLVDEDAQRLTCCELGNPEFLDKSGDRREAPPGLVGAVGDALPEDRGYLPVDRGGGLMVDHAPMVPDQGKHGFTVSRHSAL